MAQLVEFAGNHVWLVAGLLAAWSAVMFYELRLRSQGATHVSAADAVRLINKGALVIDVRKPEEFENGHIVNARNVPLERVQQDDDAINKQKSKILLAVCGDGATLGPRGGPPAQGRLRERVQPEGRARRAGAPTICRW